jgi:hypothetical protein
MLAGLASVILLHFSSLFPVHTGPFAILPGHLALTLWPVIMIAGIVRRSHAWIAPSGFLTGVISSSLLQMTLIADGMSHSVPFFVMARRAMLGFLPALALGTMAFVSLHHNRKQKAAVPSKGNSITAISALILTVFSLRGFHYILLAYAVSNSERSLMLAGVEIHHIVTGMIASYCLWLIAQRYPRVMTANLYALFIGITLGLVADQVLYFALSEVTDAAYAGKASTLGAVFFPILYAAWLRYSWLRPRL